MKKKTLYFLSYFFLCLGTYAYGQVKVSEFVQASRLSEPGDDKLVFVDFWATWCKPCIHVSKYVETLQKQFPDDFYAVSLTKESRDVVHRFLPKHPSGLAIAIDQDGETFLRHGITTLPYGVLYNTKGEKVWQGHPADLTEKKLRGLIRRNQGKKRKGFNNIVHLTGEGQTERVSLVEYRPVKPIEVKLTGTGEKLLYEKGEYTRFAGKLEELVTLLGNVSAIQVDIPEEKNSFVELYALTDIWKNHPQQVLKEVYAKSGVSEHVINKEGEVYRLTVKDPSKLWDDKQLDWGRDSPKFLVDDMQIQADNVSFGEFLTRLGSLLEAPVVSTYHDDTPRDWKLQYRFYELMESQLYDTYGIEIVRDTAVFPITVLR
ncbi:TlpA family protein disulfide reductase [Sinomicrobium weinanense]|uniref:TlpA family protein disulfide reductase n=1 Tax=Sinomicrobium weinanense TaxID=2842200 RepID=A0A926JPV7_9FLAO|nr:TlpA disulfide reductase family protein [Sinomicrobium weinanense]MBC9795184.1 TlpA family protein disulfide reductase [Sinomicrobium weinanense]MBU3121961.1 TlpA family protein disulfide reductase [Sinomicrobium weinanense]